MNRARPSVLAVGECLVELRHRSPALADVSVAGDTYNTAVYLERVASALGVEVDVGYLTGLGEDAYSRRIREAWTAESITDRSLVVDGRLPGLYAITTDERGERFFTYWRKDSAAAALLSGLDWLPHVDADAVHFSGITLQLLTPTSMAGFLERLSHIQGSNRLISFDTNYRPAGWKVPGEQSDAASAARARDAFDLAAARSQVVFASLDDETLLRGAVEADDVIAQYLGLGAREVVCKLGPAGAIVADGSTRHHILPNPHVHVVDTTAAGDALAGAYLAARLAGRSPVEAGELGVAVASEVIKWPGAIAPRSEFRDALAALVKPSEEPRKDASWSTS